MAHIYTATKLAGSTCQRKLARVSPGEPVMTARPFTIWTDSDTECALFSFPKQTRYESVWRAPNNRANRRALKLAGLEMITP